MQNTKGERPLCDAFNGGTQLFSELCAKPRFLLLVPAVCIQRVGSCLAPEDHLLHLDVPSSL
jgi:hypothetical protein